MPSPLAHTAVGLLLSRRADSRAERWFAVKLAMVGIFFSMAPDLDILPAMLMGDMPRFHNNLSHSPVFGLLFCAVLAVPAWLFLGRRFTLLRTAGFALVCFALHLLMDWMTYSRGLMLLWPLADDRFISPVLFFYGVRWSNGFFSPTHLITIANELAFIGVLLVVWRWRQRVRGDQATNTSLR